MAGADDMMADHAGGLSDDNQLATFRIGDELFGLGISTIREIVRYPEITSVPRSPDYLTGLANMRGNVLPVIDARIRLGMTAVKPTDATRVLVIDHGGTATGLIVDMVCGVISLEHVEKESPPPLLDVANGSGVDARYVRSVVKVDGGRKIIMEIDAEALCLTELGRGNVSSDTRSSSAAATDSESSVQKHAEIQLVTFLVAREEYGFPIESVREVLRIGKITEVPDVAPYLLGILSIRNALLPVVDIRRLFGLPGRVEDLSHELDEVNRFAQHLSTAFAQHLSRGAAWTADSTAGAVREWFDTLHTSSEVLGRQFLLLRLLCQKLLGAINIVRREQGRHVTPETVTRVLAETQSLSEQIALRVSECKSVLAHEIQEDQRILVIEVGRMPVGILVDRMQQVIRLPEEIIEQTPALLHSQNAATLKGIVKLDNGKRLVMLINQDTMLQCEDLEELGDGSYGMDLDAEAALANAKTEDSLQLVTFRLGEEEFGLSIDEVQEINRLDGITAVPRAPAFVEGVMNLRGNVIPAIDLRKRFGLPSMTHDESTRVIIVNMNGKLTGFIVDSVSEVFRLDRRSIELPPEVIRTNLNMDFIRGICKASNNKMVVLIEVSKILAGHEQELLNASLGSVAPAVSAKPTPPKPPIPSIPATPPETVTAVPAEEPAVSEAPQTERHDTPPTVQIVPIVPTAQIVPTAPIVSEVPATPSTSDIPDIPDIPATPEISECTEIPGILDVSDVPEVPEETPAAEAALEMPVTSSKKKLKRAF